MLKFSMILPACAALAAFSFASPAQAQEDFFAGTYNTLLKQFKDAGGKVEYIGKAFGMNSWILINKENKPQFVYTNDQGATVMGILFAPNGEMETQKQAEKYQIVSHGLQKALISIGSYAEKSEVIYRQFENASWIAIGSEKAPYIYTTISMDSQNSIDMVKKLMPYIDKGQIALRIIPIATSEKTYYSAAQLLSTDDPQAAFINFVKTGDTSLLDKTKLKEEAFSKLDINAGLAQTAKIKGVPFNIYRRPYDGKIMVISGVPENNILLLSELQKNQSQTEATAAPAPAVEPKQEAKGKK